MKSPLPQTEPEAVAWVATVVAVVALAAIVGLTIYHTAALFAPLENLERIERR